MRYSHRLFALLVFGGLLGSHAASQSQRTNERSSVRAALHAKKGVVLVAKPAGRPEEGDEAYGDWADRLNRFATHEGKDFKIVVVTRAKFAQIVEEPKVKEDYAILFMLDPEHGLFYDGMILDYSDYQRATGYLKQQKPGDKPMPAYGLHKVSVRLK